LSCARGTRSNNEGSARDAVLTFVFVDLATRDLGELLNVQNNRDDLLFSLDRYDVIESRFAHDGWVH
jgi:hypothetical protein